MINFAGLILLYGYRTILYIRFPTPGLLFEVSQTNMGIPVLLIKIRFKFYSFTGLQIHQKAYYESEDMRFSNLE